MERLKKSLFPLSWGAESNLYSGIYLGHKVVIKERIKKPYMNPKLAEKLIRERTLAEAKILWEANSLGVKAPLPLKIDPERGVIIMSYIEGELLRDMIYREGFSLKVKNIMEEMGRSIAILHNSHIIHGDLTTSNVIYQYQTKNLYLIDFGLSFHSKRSEDKATDIRVLERAVESTHPEYKNELMSSFLSSYFEKVNERDLIWESLEDIRLRGRYIKERQA
ncbi:MAG: Kae1-associated kinase Bud32 [Fervidicoccaceae archaeon]|jgi:TP53 regulating kinase-like protein|uniref:non-specific serine/threonine protein kinase n=1 Tax=Fervidicoccus fontis TaxID=683846 RepID=A0A7C2UL29_9CREN|nr:MAG: Kae1-associated kinase Bud32 [Fervidicoccus sp.]HEU97609.1 Kae1-associated kinase Bud32 [Fervidicoccus fontis]